MDEEREKKGNIVGGKGPKMTGKGLMREGKERGSMEGKKGPGEERIIHRERKGPGGRKLLDYT